MELKTIESIRNLNQTVRNYINGNILPEKPLNFTQFQMIRYLLIHKDEDVCQKDLEIETHLNKASVTGAIDSLENKGIVRRVSSEKDKRKKYVVLTEKAQEKHKELDEKAYNTEQLLTSNIDPKDLETFYSVIEQMHKNLERSKQ